MGMDEEVLCVRASLLDKLGAFTGFVGSFVLVRRVWRVLRIILDAGIRIPNSTRLWGSWSYLVLLLPLVYRMTQHSSGLAEDGAHIDTVFEYGATWASVLLSAVAIMLFQLLIRLEALNPKTQMQNKASHHNPLPAPSRTFPRDYNPQPESKPRSR